VYATNPFPAEHRSKLFERFLDHDPCKIREALEAIRRRRRRDVVLARRLFNTPPLGCGYYTDDHERGGEYVR
jgi:hypothetical protein